MNIHEFHTDSFMAGYAARTQEVEKTILRARKEHKNVVTELRQSGVFDFRTMTLRAEAAAGRVNMVQGLKVKKVPLTRRIRALWGG